MKILTLLVPLVFALSAVRGEPLLHETFANGSFTADWTQKPKEYEIIADDTAKNGYALRLHQSRRTLAMLPNDGRPVSTWTEDQIQKWKNYQYTIRYRLEKRPEPPAEGSRNHAIFALLWRCHPTEESSREALLITAMIDQNAKGYSGVFWFHQPRVNWFGKQEIFAETDIMNQQFIRGIGKGVPMDTAWHELEVSVVGDRSTILFDGEKIYSGQDKRAPAGGIGVTPYLDDTGKGSGVRAILIDEIKVEPLPNNE